MKLYKRFFKRILDLLIAIPAFLLLLPVFFVLYIAIWYTMGRPVFFKQKRPGLNTRIFEIIKFRSMKNAIDTNGNNLPDAERITKLGTFMRRNSLDEIPQLLNVIKGDMSLVGPRPLVIKYLPFYTEEEMTRHNVRPGITGLAQINGRNAIDWDSKLKYDIEYVKNLSLRLDIYILFKTFIKVLIKSNVSSSGIDAPGDFDRYRQKTKKTEL